MIAGNMQAILVLKVLVSHGEKATEVKNEANFMTAIVIKEATEGLKKQYGMKL